MADHLIIFDTTLRDGEQSPGASMTTRREAAHRAPARAPARRRDRGGLPGVVQRRLRGGAGDRRPRSRTAPSAGWRAPTTTTSRARPRRSSRRASGRIHTFIATSPIHMEKKLRMTPDAGARAGGEGGPLGAQPTPTTSSSRPRTPAARSPTSCAGVLEAVIAAGRDHGQHPRHRRLRDARAVRRADPHAARARPELRQGGLVGALPQRPGHGGGQLAGRA